MFSIFIILHCSQIISIFLCHFKYKSKNKHHKMSFWCMKLQWMGKLNLAPHESQKYVHIYVSKEPPGLLVTNICMGCKIEAISFGLFIKKNVQSSANHILFFLSGFKLALISPSDYYRDFYFYKGIL